MEQRVLIVGGGLNGPCLAIALAQAGLHSTLIDAQTSETHHDPGFDGRCYALAHSTMRMLKALGLWAGLEDMAQPILGIKASDGRAGEGPSPFFLHFDHADLEEGPMGFIVEDRHLRARLWRDVAERPEITYLPGTIVTGQAPGRVELSTGTTLEGALIVGADGRGSQTARRAGIKRMAWGYGQTALVAALAHEKPHNGIAHQFFMPAGPLAILPLTGNRCSIVWSERSEEAERILNLPESEFIDHLKPRFGSFLGEISAAGRRYCYPLGLSLTDRFVAERLALVGDAAHGVHPIAGQGLNLGFRDVAALAQTLGEAQRRGEDIGTSAVLRRYQSWRRFDTAALAVATDSFNRLFSNDNSILRFARDAGMGLVNAIPPVKRAFMRQAAGLNGPLPRLLRGEPL
ncbi:MAG: UbiH/UbiF/VisC/COQ6 family ubiquinone biosynthesis hydroxylase [Pseudomonadota bacterium]